MNRPFVLLAALAGPALLSASGGGEPSPRQAAGKVTVRTATCQTWNATDPATRRRLVQGMRTFFAGPVDASGQRGQVLADERAHALFDGYCAQPFALHFGLYRLYGRAAGFTAGR
jgi:hypothetical protein